MTVNEAHELIMGLVQEYFHVNLDSNAGAEFAGQLTEILGCVYSAGY